jgi:tripartite-type tricarboxylate transporter receptor subunit TctC
MKIKKYQFLKFFIVLLLLGFIGFSSAAANEYPSKTITIVAPFSAGGGADLMSRALAPAIEEALGTSVVVVNITGANGCVGLADVARSKPDGYRLILNTTGPSTLGPNISDVGYTYKDFVPICQLSDLPTGLALHKSSGITNLDEFFAAAEKRAAEGKPMTYGSSGAGSTHNLAIEGLLLSIDKVGLLTHISFEGGSQAATALLGQHIDASANILTELIPYMETDFNIIGIASGQRSSIDPSIPTFKEQGYDAEQSTWYAISAPAGTPEEIVSLLDSTIKDALNDPYIKETFEDKLKVPIEYLDHVAMAEKWEKAWESNAKLVEVLGLK